MTVYFDSSSTSGLQTADTYSWTHTVGTGPNNILVVGGSYATLGTRNTIYDVSVDGISMVRALRTSGTFTGGQSWYAVGLSVGAHSISVACSSGTTTALGASYGLTMFGNNQSSVVFVTKPNGGSITASHDILNQNGGLVCDTYAAVGISALSGGADQTEVMKYIFSNVEGWWAFGGSYQIANGYNVYTMGWSINNQIPDQHGLTSTNSASGRIIGAGSVTGLSTIKI